MFFGKPEMLWLLAIVPLLVWFYVRTWRVRQRLIRQFVQVRLLATLTVGVSPRLQQARMTLVVMAVTLVLLALGRPLWGYALEEYTRRGVDILVAVDTSRSMLARDVQPDRLTRAKLAALDLMKLAEGDRLGLIAFAGTAFLQCPLTVDWGAFEESVNALDTGVILQQGTALGAVIDNAAEAFKSEGDNYKALVILTDGEDHEAGVLAATRRAAKAGVRIYTVGVGTPEGDQLRLRNANGETQYITDDDGRPVTSTLNDNILREIANATEGEYIPLKGANPMKLLYENRIALLPQSEYGARLGRRYFDRYQWPLGAALLLLLIEMLLPRQGRQNRAAVSPATPSGAGQVAAMLVFLLVGASALPVQASARQALHAYEEGDYGAAREEFQRLISEGKEDPRLHFNAGVSAYRLHEYEEAANEHSAAILSSEPELLQPAYYNLGNALFRMGEAAQDPALKKQRWESAVKAYEGALKLDEQDADTRHNIDVVKAKLELLKQQQEQQQQQQQQQQDQQDQKDQQDDQKQQDQQNQDQQQQQQDQQSEDKEQQQQQQSQDQQQQQDSQDQGKQQEQQKQEQPPSPGKEDDQKKQEQQAASNSKEERDGQEQPANAQPVPKDQMTPEQARRLLEAARSDEHQWSEAERRRQPHTQPAGKPW